MAEFAKVINGKVVDVITADENFFSNFVDRSPGTWIETFVDESKRNKYAGVGYLYNREDDYFYQPSPYPSWTFNTKSKSWEPPVSHPDADDDSYEWNESKGAWETE